MGKSSASKTYSSATVSPGNALRAGVALSTLGQSEAALAAKNKYLKGPGDAQGQQTLEQRNRLKALMTEDNLQYFTPEQQARYKSGLELGQGQIAPQDELNYYKTKADELELAVANNRERAKMTQEQIKLLQNTPGAKQTKNPEYLLQNAAKAPESILTAGQGAQAASKQGTILT